MIAFVNRVAAQIAPLHPQVLIDTLAYAHTFEPPRSQVTLPNVVVRVAPLYQRNFAAPVTAPSNREVRSALEGWRRHTRHLRVWDYAVAFGPEGDLPLPNLATIAEDLRFYRGLGVEGVFMQHAHPVGADMRDLKQWVLTKLLEDPTRSTEALVDEFSAGFYGPAGKWVRRYLTRLERAARRRPARIGFPVSWADYVYLDTAFLLEGQRIFDRAARSVADEPALAERVDHARLTLDRATLILAATGSVDEARELDAVDLAALRRRYRATWLREVERRLPPRERASAVASMEAELLERVRSP